MADGDPEVDDWAIQLAEAAGEGAEVGDAFGVPVFDVPSGRWVETLRAARDAGLTFFDWLSAVDEQDEGFSVVAHIADMSSKPVLHLLVRTRIARDAPSLPTATSVYRGAAWHERETHEMFGIDFDGHPDLTKLLLSDEFEGHPLRKEFVLAARAAKPWPGAKEPGEGSGGASPSRRRMQPPGVPDPSWGPRPPGQPAGAPEDDAPEAETAAVSAGGPDESGGGADAEARGEKTAAMKAPAETTTSKTSTAKKATAKRTTAKEAAAGKSTAKEAPAGKSAAKKSTAKKTTAKEAPAEKSTAKKSTAKEAAAEKTAAKKSTAKKSTAKKAAAEKTTAKKTTAKKAAEKSTAKKSTAKKAAAEKTTAKKTTAKKAAEKSTAKKSSTKKAATEKTTAKKSTAKEAAAEKTTTKKTTTKKTTAKKATGENASEATARDDAKRSQDDANGGADSGGDAA